MSGILWGIFFIFCVLALIGAAIEVFYFVVGCGVIFLVIVIVVHLLALL